MRGLWTVDGTVADMKGLLVYNSIHFEHLFGSLLGKSAKDLFKGFALKN